MAEWHGVEHLPLGTQRGVEQIGRRGHVAFAVHNHVILNGKNSAASFIWLVWIQIVNIARGYDKIRRLIYFSAYEESFIFVPKSTTNGARRSLCILLSTSFSPPFIQQLFKIPAQ